ncbi:MAG: hypothetical protein A3B70_05575 [Deltaproteobacteria bacterium RIFCSPHIGHO2_02_FULL_40_11]|nr:MAG: hypothetical protein A3B70_05575 [Deltaproteobacteria bacterium RIFCSPHIGHO2_02_FULL_40_11]
MDQKNLSLLEEFSFWLMLIAVSVRSGLSLTDTLKALQRKWPKSDISHAWGIFLSELRLGKSKEEALKCFQNALPPMPIIETFCQTLILSFKQGISIADLLTQQSQSIFLFYTHQKERLIYKKQLQMLLPLFLLILPATMIFIATPILIQLQGAL